MSRASGQKVIAFAMLLVLSASLFAPQLFIQKASADGFTTHIIDAKIKDRNASLKIKLNPPILTSESRQDAFLQLRLFDSNTNKTIEHTSYFITVSKGTPGEEEKEQRLLLDLFHSHDGLLTLKIEPAEGEIKVFGTREDFQQAWVADPGGTIKIRGPLLLEGGLYHIRVEIFGIDFDTTIFTDAEAPKFDTWLSVGDISRHNIEYKGESYSTTIISYYDQVNSFNFDEPSKTFSWSMPFDWNTTRIKETPIFVHEELRIPKTLDIANTNTFSASVNDISISGRKLAKDPFSSETELTLHYLLNKKDLVSLSEQVSSGSPEMKFTLTPGGNATEQTTGEFVTDTGGIQVNVNWTPSNLKAETESTVKVQFSDAHSGGPLNSDVNYDLRILDKDRNMVFEKTGLTAKGSTDTQTITFPRDETYNIEVEVTGLVKDGQTPDLSRNGIARGIVIVPEFPAGTVLVIAGLFGTLLAFQRLKTKNRNNA